MSTKLSVYLYFATLGLFAFAMLGSGAADLLQPQALQAGMRHLGYPDYFVSLLGVWKLLGVAAIVAPGFPRLKEWAYAGFTFDLSGAVVSHLVSGDRFGKALVPLLLLAIGLASFGLRTQGRKLPDLS